MFLERMTLPGWLVPGIEENGLAGRTSDRRGTALCFCPTHPPLILAWFVFKFTREAEMHSLQLPRVLDLTVLSAPSAACCSCSAAAVNHTHLRCGWLIGNMQLNEEEVRAETGFLYHVLHIWVYCGSRLSWPDNERRLWRHIATVPWPCLREVSSLKFACLATAWFYLCWSASVQQKDIAVNCRSQNKGDC